MNSVALIGRMARDPDVRYTSEQKAIARFSLAVDRPAKNGEKTADFIPCVAFGKTAEIIEKYCLKGKQVGITGNIKTGSYEKDGHKYYTTDVVVDRLDLLGGLEVKPEQPPVEYKQEELKYESPIPGFEAMDDIPF